MSVTKFRFVSPGVQVAEIDNSQIPRLPEAIGPVVIGRSLRGPMMRPVKVDSFSDFVDVFGEPKPGNASGDIWRSGAPTAPTYGAYAAQAYLKNSSPLTFVRLGGYQQNSDAGVAGWSYGTAYGLFVVKTSGSTTVADAQAPLAAIIYSTGSVGLTGKELSGSTVIENVTGTLVQVDAADLQLRLVLGSTTASVNFNPDSSKYIRKVLNTNPARANADLATSGTLTYFLGETYNSWVESKLGEINGNDYAAFVVPLDADYSNFERQAQYAESGWVVSQHLGDSGSFTPVNGVYPVTNLFKAVSLTEGEWFSKNLKVTIEDIKEPTNKYTSYGTFTLSIRKMEDNDNAPIYVERFSGLTLDPSSENYIARRIGDKYSSWSYEKQAYLEYGNYDNNSKFIRVVMNPDVDTSLVEASLLPYGFYGPNVLAVSGTANGDNMGSQLSTIALSGNTAFALTASMPELPMLLNSTSSVSPSLSSVTWGLDTVVANSKRYNEDLVDLVRVKAVDYGNPSFMFTLDELSGTATVSAWVEGSRVSGSSLTTGGRLSGSSVLTVHNKFTLPMLGGFDGLNVLEKDPFNYRVLEGKSADTSYAYNSIKVAIDSLSDPEVVEMNLATIPGVANEALTNLLIEKCEMRGDALAIVDLDGDYEPDAASRNTQAGRPSVDTVVTNMKDRALNTSYGCAYFPWVLAKDSINNAQVWLPPSIAALGTFSSAQRTTELWFAPAGFNRGGLSNGSAGLPIVQTALRLNSKDRDALYESNINPIATFPSEGIVIFGQKTLQVTPSALDRVNVRRLMIYLKKEISRFASIVLFDPNVQVTWKRFTNQAEPFLASVKSRFGLSEYRLILDETTTTADLVDRNIVYAKILLKPTRAIEFIALDFVITNTGASFND